MNGKSCVVDSRLFYFNNDRKLELFYLHQKCINCEKEILPFSSLNVLNSIGTKKMKMDCLFLSY